MNSELEGEIIERWLSVIGDKPISMVQLAKEFGTNESTIARLGKRFEQDCRDFLNTDEIPNVAPKYLNAILMAIGMSKESMKDVEKERRQKYGSYWGKSDL